MNKLPDNYDLHKEQKNFHDRLLVCIYTFIQWSRRDSYCSHLFADAPRLLNISTHLSYSDPSIFAIMHVKRFRTKRLNPAYQKQRCLLVALYHVLRTHRGYMRGELSAVRLNHCISYLENIAKNGLDEFEVRGNIRTGWRLR